MAKGRGEDNHSSLCCFPTTSAVSRYSCHKRVSNSEKIRKGRRDEAGAGKENAEWREQVQRRHTRTRSAVLLGRAKY